MGPHHLEKKTGTCSGADFFNTIAEMPSDLQDFSGSSLEILSETSDGFYDHTDSLLGVGRNEA